MKQETIPKNNIYIGNLIQPEDISIEQYEQKYQRLSQKDKQEINRCGRNIWCKELIRPILFEKDNNNLARDLIYKINRKYPILELNSHLQEYSPYIVENIIRIEKLLTYLGYKEFLTKHEIKKVYRQLIVSTKWLDENKQLFGYVEIAPDIFVDIEKGEISADIYSRLKKFNLLLKRKPTKEEYK